VPRPALTSRDDLTDALIRVVVEQGLDAVSIRTVARAAGVSIGTVQYRFPTKDDLLLAAYERAIDQVSLRARAVAEQDPAPATYVRSLLRELLPLDDRREAELRVALAFSARSVYSPRLTELYTEGYRALVDAVVGALEQAVERGEAAPGVEPRRDATAAVAVADGLAWHRLCAPAVLTADAAEAALDAHLARLLPPR
ncbi:MAG TPA: TetR/AcrR family transcriptional regulator, partial [Solirubrobacteraceae bacterium]|nr:TetR/AcrR family transcriptional regulator [Solirubrobacteraceae bacterium]